MPESATADAAVKEKKPEDTKKDEPVWANFKMKRLATLRPEFEPYGFQYFSTYKAIKSPRFLVGLATGTGKTLVSYLTYEYEKLVCGADKVKLLIITKNSAVKQFTNEHHKFFDVPDCIRNPVYTGMDYEGADYATARKQVIRRWAKPRSGADNILHGDDALKILTSTRITDILVISYNVCRMEIDELEKAVVNLTKGGCRLFVIADEATEFQNLDTATHRAVAKLTKRAHRAIGLTATMTKGKLESLYGIFKGIGVSLASTKDEFMDYYCISFQPRGSFKRKVTGYQNTGKFIEAIRDLSIVIRKADVAPYLPSLARKIIEIEHDDVQIQLINQIYAGKLTLDGSADPLGREVTELTRGGYIKRALLDPGIVVHPTKLPEAYIAPKTKALIRFLQDETVDEKVVFYANSLQYLRRLVSQLKRVNDLEPYYRNICQINGDVTGEARDEQKRLFQEENTHRLMLINDAGTESVNLQSANNVVVGTMPITGGNLVQLVGRISRIDTKHTALLASYMLTEQSQDQDEYDIVMQQIQIINAVHGEVEKGLLDEEAAKRASRMSELSDEEFAKQSAERLLLTERKKRKLQYSQMLNNLRK